jgi:hypothetical protein
VLSDRSLTIYDGSDEKAIRTVDGIDASGSSVQRRSRVSSVRLLLLSSMIAALIESTAIFE